MGQAMAWLAVGELKSRSAALFGAPLGGGWRMAGFAIFLAGVILGAKLDNAASWALACFIVLSPLLVLAGLFYESPSETKRNLPSFRTLLILMLLCWTVLEVFALGTLVLGWNAVARFLLLLIMATAIAGLIFYHFAKESEVPPN
jgi:hypothetical protein